jgi:hypothetical protein
MQLTGKSMPISYEGREILYHYQSCKDWTHPYLYQGEGNENLSTSGCGIFALCHAVEWLSDLRLNPDEMADFSMENGGRGDDGTDRPALLHALMATGKAREMGFEYHEDGLRNDLDTLFTHLYENKGVAFCNLRRGHIVALIGARIVEGQKQLLAIDSVAESINVSVRKHISEVIPQSETYRAYVNESGVYLGESKQFAMFWVDAALPVDFNLLHRI